MPDYRPDFSICRAPLSFGLLLTGDDQNGSVTRHPYDSPDYRNRVDVLDLYRSGRPRYQIGSTQRLLLSLLKHFRSFLSPRLWKGNECAETEAKQANQEILCPGLEVETGFQITVQTHVGQCPGARLTNVDLHPPA